MAGHDGIYQRGRTSWRIVVSAGRDPLTAKYATVRETIRGTKTDAKKRLTELRAEVQRGTVAKGGTETAAAYLPRYIEHRIAIGKVRPRTANTYRTYVARWVVPRIGSLRLSQVRAVHVQRVLDEALSAGLSARSVLQVHRILHGAFRQAVRWNLMAVNPSDGVTPPEAKPPKLTTPKPAQVAKLIAAADENRRALLSVAAATGMRRGEVLGLRWADVEGDSVNVRGSLQRIGGELRLVEPKSSRGYRMIPLPPSVSALLRHHRMEQAKRRLICGEAWADNDYIFDSGAGQALDPDNVSHAFHRAATKAGLAGVRLHDLRHAFCTQLVEAGVAASIVSQVAGHANPGFTLSTYVHHDEEAARQVADAMEAALGKDWAK